MESLPASLVLTPRMPVPDSVFSLDTLHRQFEDMKLAEQDRQDYVNNLLSLIRDLSTDRDDKIKSLRAKEMLAKTYQDLFEDAEKRIGELKRDIDSNMFVLVLIDGDDTLFEDSYVSDGVQGGERAARDLNHALSEHLKTTPYFTNDHKIVTRIYLNLTGLSRTYGDANIGITSELFQSFVQGFNKTYELMEVIDAGNGKEGADSKIKAEFGMFEKNLQCKQIFLAGSGDNGYGGLLRPCVPNVGKSEKVTLIEALPFVYEQRSLLDKFETVRFDDLFRDRKLVVRRPSTHDEAKTNSMSSSVSEPAYKLPNSYAAMAVVTKSTADGNITAGAPQEWKTTAASKLPWSTYYYVNNLNQRIDPPIKGFNKLLADELKKRKLCNAYHLESKCPYGKFCLHAHGEKLTPDQLENLRYVARLAPCESGFGCVNATCYKGHRCQFGTQCMHLQKGQCNFSDEMHRVDVSNPRKVVSNK